ncbi:MAG: rod shape-determining protein RodA [Candidatus Omnitrophica bacterium]|nr:rod shape-determining protein RodA [Candidatus Omnitrophota bacterium]
MSAFTRILLIAFLIACIGILSIYSSTFQVENARWHSLYLRQLLWVLLGLVFFILAANFNYRRLWDITYFLYFLALFLLVLVFALGIIRLGAQRWLKLAWFNFQPSEIVKLIVIIFLARYFSSKSDYDLSLDVHKYGLARSFILPFSYVAIPVWLIMDQPDLGSATIILFIFLGMVYLSGAKLRYIFSFLLSGLLLLPVFWHFLRDYQRDRLLVFLNPNVDPLGAGYTVIQSKIAIGSGGLFGKGWLGGTQSQLHFLPESHTDFIFATFSEEWGFCGVAVLFVLYYLLIREGMLAAESKDDSFARLLASGISMMFCIQVLINIAMNMGFAPVVGLPLPLMSYGGSSMIVTFISLGILANIARQR